MNSSHRRFPLAVVGLSVALGLCHQPSVALAQAAPPPVPSQASPPSARALSEQTAVERAVAQNPNLHVALLQATQGEYDVKAEEGLYSMLGSANTAVTHTRQPGLDSDGGVGISTSDTIDVGAGLTKPFPFGTVVGATIGGQRTVRTGSVSLGEPARTLGPGYSLVGQLTLTQPFLRGAGEDVGLASLRQARLRRTAAALAADATASALLNEVLRAYWELWYADQVIRINEASRELAREQARQATEQVRSGALAEIDALTYQTRSAELDEAVVLAVTDRRQRSLSLGLLLGESAGAGPELATSDSLPEPIAGPADTAGALADAEKASPDLLQLQAQIEIVQDQLKIAGDPLRPRLDLDAYVQVQGLGNREVPPAFEQAGRLEAVSAHVGLTFEAPLDGTRRRSQIASAQLSQHIAKKQLEASRQRLRTDVMSALAARDAAEKRVEVASETVRVSGSQAEAERRRFTAGISIALQVQEAENSLRQAQLRLERARVDMVLSEIALAYLRGRLLERYRGVLARLPQAPPRLDSLAQSPL
jgi:outer membrane protein